jgi:V8-like Glu-specific endopeptidase
VGTAAALFLSGCGDPDDVDRPDGFEVEDEAAETHVATDVRVGALLEPMRTPSALQVGLALDDDLATFGGSDGEGLWFKKDAQAWHDLFAAIAACDAMTVERPPWYVKPHEWQFLGRVEFATDDDDLDEEFSEEDTEPTGPEGDFEDLPLLQQWKLVQDDRPILVDLEFGLAFRSRTDLFVLRHLDLVAMPSEPIDEEVEASVPDEEDGGEQDGAPLEVPGTDHEFQGGDTSSARGEDSTGTADERVLAPSSGEDETAAIFGPDGRIYVPDPTNLPWRRAAQIRRLVNGAVVKGGKCSAAMAGPRHAWTAAHCIIDKNGKFQQAFSIVPAANGNGVTNMELPFGHFPVKAVLFPNAFTSGATARTDWMIAVMASPRGYDKWFGSQSAKRSQIKNRFHRAVGYPGEFLNGDLIGCDDGPFGSCDDYMYYQDAKVRRVYVSTLRTRHDGVPGQSGSGIIRMNATGTSGFVRGVLNREGSNWTYARRLSRWVILNLCDLYEDYPSSVHEVSCE